MNIGVVALTDSESIEVVVKSVIKGHLVEHSRPDHRDADILYSDTNQINNERCWQSRKWLIKQLCGILADNKIPAFTSPECKEYNGTRYYEILLMSYETITNLNMRQFGSFKIT